MRIVLLSVDDEFAGEMQKYLYKYKSEYIVGSLISDCIIYKKNLLTAIYFIINRSGLKYLFIMFIMKFINSLKKSEKGVII